MKTEVQHIEFSIKSDLTCVGYIGDFEFEKSKNIEEFKEDILEYLEENISDFLEDIKIEKVWYEKKEYV